MNFHLHAPLPSEPETILQRIEVVSFFQIPSFQIIGLPAPEVAEAKERIHAAIESSKFTFPKRRVILNLSPASLRKRGTGLDLPMALAVLLDGDKSDESPLQGPPHRIAAWAELGLDGETKGAGQLFRVFHGAWKEGLLALLIAEQEWAHAREAREVMTRAKLFPPPAPSLWPCANLSDAWEALRRIHAGEGAPEPTERKSSSGPQTPELKAPATLLPLSPALERLVACAAAGRHHLLLLGPRGAGKSRALEWRAYLEPSADLRTQIERRLIAELASPAIGNPEATRRVGSQVRPQALIGSASPGVVKPGEFSLASGGLLLADELPEWARDSREALREPLERRRISLTRVHGSLELPADFTLAANGNVCPCGGWPKDLATPERDRSINLVFEDPILPCRCSDRARTAYLERLSGPLLDRIDLSIWLTPKRPELIAPDSARSRLNALREKVAQVRHSLIARWGAPPGAMEASEVEAVLRNHPSIRAQLESLPASSLRSRHKIVRLALTLAEWDSREGGIPGRAQFQEARRIRGESLVERIRAGSS